jgi:hypothetical protein
MPPRLRLVVGICLDNWMGIYRVRHFMQIRTFAQETVPGDGDVVHRCQPAISHKLKTTILHKFTTLSSPGHIYIHTCQQMVRASTHPSFVLCDNAKPDQSIQKNIEYNL